MASTIDWNQTTEQEGLGNVTVTFTDDDGKVLCVLTDRVDTRDGDSIKQFMDHAMKLRSQAIAKVSARPEVLKKLQAVFDSTESQVAEVAEVKK